MHRRRVELKIRGAAPSESGITKRIKGNILHRALSFIKSREDLDKIEMLVKKAILLEGENPKAWDIQELAQHLKKAVEMDEVEPFFDPEAEAYCETPIILPGDSEGAGGKMVPDRLLVTRDKVVVLDYKSGEPNKEYHAQVRRYAEAAKSAFGKEEAEGYLLFLLPEPKIERVV